MDGRRLLPVFDKGNPNFQLDLLEEEEKNLDIVSNQNGDRYFEGKI